MKMSVQPRKQFGQHWLRSDKALAAIVAAAELKPSDRILEIGPGQGVLTKQILPLVESLLAVEIDRDLCKLLVKKIGGRENFLLLQGDFLTLDVAANIGDFPNFQNQNKVVANIPYNITGPILEKLLGTIAHPPLHSYESIVLLIQKEVADRVTARAGSKAFGALSVRVQYRADCEFITHVPASAFYPPPKVDSAVVRLRPRPLKMEISSPKFLDTLVKLGFAQKRKMLRNNLQTVVERDRLTEILKELGIKSEARAEEISLEHWVKLSNILFLEKPV